MKKSLTVFLATLSTTFVGFLGHAQTTNIYWNFNTATPTSGSFTGLTVSSVTQGNNHGTTTLLTTTSASSGYTNAAGFVSSGGTNAGAAVFTNAFSTATSTYLAFDITISLAAGMAYQMTDLTFGSRQTSTGPQLLSLYESSDGFASDFTSLGSVSVAANSIWTAHDILLSTPLTINDNGNTISFRLYASGGVGNATASTANFRMDDLSVTLTAVPEPSSVALATLGGIACFFVARRKR